MSEKKEFYTLKGYQLQEPTSLTYAMEDYLEMIYRISAGASPHIQGQHIVRIQTLAAHLNVRPSSASKMVRNLSDGGYVDFPRYGSIILTQKGLATGAYLLHRHEVLHHFFCLLNHSEHELEQVEKIEHFINDTTLKNLELLTCKLEQFP